MNRGFLMFANDNLNVDVHLNCWRCFKDENIVIIDYGIMLKKTSIFEKFVLFFPFNFTINDFECIGKKTLENRKLIFNADLTTTNNGKTEYYTEVQEENGNKWGVYAFQEESDIKFISLKEIGTFLEFEPTQEHLVAIRNLEQCYFRIRVRTTLENLSMLFIKEKANDFFLKSSSEYREIISFRFNNKRDISSEISQYITKNGLKMIDIDSVRLFFITNSQFDLYTSKDNSEYTTRLIETERWKKYLSELDIFETSCCYYWKSKKTREDKHYSFLFDIRKCTCNVKTIMIYIVGLIFINLFSNIIFSLFSCK